MEQHTKDEGGLPRINALATRTRSIREQVSSVRGQLIVELLIAFGIGSILLPALLTVFTSAREGRSTYEQRLTATALLREAQETVRSVREADWDEVSVNGTYHPQVSGSRWVLQPGSEVVEDFTRSIAIGDFLKEGKTDPSIKKVDILVSWGEIFPRVVSSTLYLTRYLGNAFFTQTFVSDFETGTKTNTVVTNQAGGEVQLAAGGKANWCEPNLSITPLDLPKQGVANAISAIEGRVFAGTGENASGVSFANVAISNTDPPEASILGTIDGYKTNGLFGEADYVYIATDNNFKEIVVIDLRGSPYSEIGYFNAPGNGNGESVFVSGNTGFMTTGSKLYNFDLSQKEGSRGIIDPDGVTLAGAGKKVKVIGNYAYVAIDSTSNQLQIVDITSPSSLVVVGQASVNAGGGRDVFVNETGTRAYLVTAASATQKEFFIIDTGDKNGERLVAGSYETSGMDPKGVVVVPGARAIVVGTGAEEYQVINILDENSPFYCEGLDIDTGVNGISSVLESDGDAYSYIITGDANAELKIIEGGPGGKFAPAGTFESSTFDPGMEVAFNRFVVNFAKPVNTDIRFQIAVADALAGSCEGVSFNFVGPDVTSNTYFSQSSAIPTDDDSQGFENPGRCLRYKVFFSAQDPSATPIFSDVTVNYSP